MPYIVDIDQARRDYPQYTFITALSPSAQKAAFHVQDQGGRDLCLKIIRPDTDGVRVRREIDALISVSHPNLSRIVEYTFSSTPDGQKHYIVEDFVEGDDLTSKYANSQPWEFAEIALFFAKMCDGLAQLRTLDLVHRDLKPSNVRVRPDGSPVIIDFGLVRHLNLPDLTQTIDGARLGTVPYFAPEQWDGTRHDIEHRTDLFAVGILLYMAMTGIHPFFRQEMTHQQLHDAVCESENHFDNATWIQAPSQWKLLSRSLLARDRVDRPFDAKLVAHMLRKLGGLL